MTSVFIKQRPPKWAFDIATRVVAGVLEQSNWGDRSPSTDEEPEEPEEDFLETDASRCGRILGKALARIFAAEFASSSLKGWPISDFIMDTKLDCDKRNYNIK